MDRLWGARTAYYEHPSWTVCKVRTFSYELPILLPVDQYLGRREGWYSKSSRLIVAIEGPDQSCGWWKHRFVGPSIGTINRWTTAKI